MDFFFAFVQRKSSFRFFSHREVSRGSATHIERQRESPRIRREALAGSGWDSGGISKYRDCLKDRKLREQKQTNLKKKLPQNIYLRLFDAIKHTVRSI